MYCFCQKSNKIFLSFLQILIYLSLTSRNVIFCSDIKCGIPGTSLKSSYNKSELMNTKVVDIGTKIKYSCDYKDAPFLVGIKERECQPYGEWTHDVPKCATLFTGHFETTITRNALNISLSNSARISGIFIKTSSLSPIQVTNIRNIESPECTDNSTYKERRYSTLFQCPTKDPNIWSHPNVSWILVTFNEKLSCDTNSCPAKVEFLELYEVSADECSKPDVPAFGKLVPMKSNGAVARFKYLCEDFFTMHSEKKSIEIACNRYDDWFPKSLPICEPNITCEVEPIDDLKVQYNWLWSETEAVVGTVATFECVDNTTKINGTAKRECRSDGQWSEEIPECKPILTTTTERPYISTTYNPYPVIASNPNQYPNQYPNQNPNQYPNPNPNQNPNPYPNQNPNQYPTQKPNPYPNPNPYPTPNLNPYPTPNVNPYPNQNVYPNPTQNPNPYQPQYPNPYQTTPISVANFPVLNNQAISGSLNTIHFVYIFLGILLGILITICGIYYFQKRRRDSLNSQSERQLRSARNGRTRDEVFYDHMKSLNNTLNESRISNTCLADQTVDSSGGLYPYDSAGYVQIEAAESLRMKSFKKYENYDRNNSPNKPLPEVPK